MRRYHPRIEQQRALEQSRLKMKVIGSVRNYAKRVQKDEGVLPAKASSYYDKYKELVNSCPQKTRENYTNRFNSDVEGCEEMSLGEAKFEILGRNIYFVGRAFDEGFVCEIDETGLFKIDGKLIDMDEFRFEKRELGKTIELEEDEETLPSIDDLY